MISIVPLNKINNTTEVINKSSIICNSHAQQKKRSTYVERFLFFIVFIALSFTAKQPLLASKQQHLIPLWIFARHITYRSRN